MITHEEQKRIWEEEHRKPQVLQQMHSSDVSSGVEKFYDFLVSGGLPKGSGIEMGCGKGRNVIWLGGKGIEMTGFDFSSVAIEEARKRAEQVGIPANFTVADATEKWPFEDDSFDFGIDCFASTDIESPEGRAFAMQEMRRVLKPGGHLLSYLLSIDDAFHAEMIRTSPTTERNAFLHPTGKFEKVFDEEEIAKLYERFTMIKKERLEKTTEFYGTKYDCSHFWIVYQKAHQ